MSIRIFVSCFDSDGLAIRSSSKRFANMYPIHVFSCWHRAHDDRAIPTFFSLPMLETLLEGKRAGRPVDEGERPNGANGRVGPALNRNFFIPPAFFSRFASQVKCTAISVPKAESVVWSFAGRELNFTSNNTPFYVQEEYAAERVVSTVTLLDPISTYFGDYNCTVTNSFGTDSVIIKLTAHSKCLISDVDYSLARPLSRLIST